MLNERGPAYNFSSPYAFIEDPLPVRSIFCAAKEGVLVGYATTIENEHKTFVGRIGLSITDYSGEPNDILEHSEESHVYFPNYFVDSSIQRSQDIELSQQITLLSHKRRRQNNEIRHLVEAITVTAEIDSKNVRINILFLGVSKLQKQQEHLIFHDIDKYRSMFENRFKAAWPILAEQLHLTVNSEQKESIGFGK